MNQVRVLFVCIHNSARSQMAEAWLRHLGGERFEVHSAGLEPGKLNPFVVQAMANVGVDISHHRAKSVDDILSTGKHFDYVIAVCDKEAAERCPVIPGGGTRLHWAFPDPSAASGDESEKLRVATEVRDSIRSTIESWIREGVGSPIS
jgi:arsenate reductase